MAGGWKALLARFKHQKRPGTDKKAEPMQGLENPYRRFYTQGRTLEDLARQARERQKGPQQK